MKPISQFEADFAAILAAMTPEEVRKELESFGAEFIEAPTAIDAGPSRWTNLEDRTPRSFSANDSELAYAA